MTGFMSLRAANVARDQEWNTGSERVSMTFRATELAGEVGEACNVIKKLERERIGLVGSRDTKEHLAEELADIVICTDLVAMDAGIDLDAAIAAKFNATSEKNGLATRLSVSPAMALPFEATPEMVKAALDLVWEESETHGDLVCRLWRAMAAVAQHRLAAPQMEGLLHLLRASANLIANRFDTYKARNGRQCSIEGDDGEKCWIVSFDDMAELEAALPTMAGFGWGMTGSHYIPSADCVKLRREHAKQQEMLHVCHPGPTGGDSHGD